MTDHRPTAVQGGEHPHSRNGQSGGTGSREAFPVVYQITVPPSLNNMYENRKGGRRKSDRYLKWRRVCLNELMAQLAKPYPHRAHFTINLPESVRGDCDNYIKPALDALVAKGVLPDDGKEYIASVRAVWVPKYLPCTVVLEAA